MGSGLNWSGGWDQIHNPESYSLEFEGIRLQATQAARSAWSVWSLLPLLNRPCITTAPASWMHF
jgi:hypothetical protein